MKNHSSMNIWLKIPEIYRIGAVIVAIITVSVTTGAAIAGLADLPKKVETMQQEIQELRSNQAQFRAEMRELKSGIQLGNCLKLSELEGFPWQRCTSGVKP